MSIFLIGQAHLRYRQGQIHSKTKRVKIPNLSLDGREEHDEAAKRIDIGYDLHILENLLKLACLLDGFCSYSSDVYTWPSLSAPCLIMSLPSEFIINVSLARELCLTCLNVSLSDPANPPPMCLLPGHYTPKGGHSMTHMMSSASRGSQDL